MYRYCTENVTDSSTYIDHPTSHRYEAFRFKKSAEAVFTGGPEHAISYILQLASNVAIIYPDSRFIDQMIPIKKR